MENNLSLHLKNFNDKIKLMNQTGKSSLVLSASEARSLHSEIFSLLAHCSNLSKNLTNSTQDTNVRMDGGQW